MSTSKSTEMDTEIQDVPQNLTPDEMYKGLDGDDTEVLDNNTKSLLMSMMGELKIGMDLTKVPIPCDFLEPRSLLEKLTDFLSHCQILCSAPDFDDPVARMVEVVRMYLSGWHVKPRGVKKPYNPILGEVFRCNYELPDGSILTYLAEQVSHHPPISALYAENVQKGIAVEGWYYPRSKFLGNSVGSMTEGVMKIHFKKRGEIYACTWPNVYGRGIIFGRLLMEMGGKTSITCMKTGLVTELEFKTKPFFGGEYNVVTGKIKKKNNTLFQVRGKWNDKIYIRPKKLGKKEDKLFFDPKSYPIVPKHVPDYDSLAEFESRKLWINLTHAIQKNDVKLATEEKSKIEERERKKKKIRDDGKIVHEPRFFKKGPEDFWSFIGFDDPMYKELLSKDLEKRTQPQQQQ
jgi:hypothetical protein